MRLRFPYLSTLVVDSVLFGFVHSRGHSISISGLLAWVSRVQSCGILWQVFPASFVSGMAPLVLG